VAGGARSAKLNRLRRKRKSSAPRQNATSALRHEVRGSPAARRRRQWLGCQHAEGLRVAQLRIQGMQRAL
jgi:hypothetical protein